MSGGSGGSDGEDVARNTFLTPFYIHSLCTVFRVGFTGSKIAETLNAKEGQT